MQDARYSPLDSCFLHPASCPPAIVSGFVTLSPLRPFAFSLYNEVVTRQRYFLIAIALISTAFALRLWGLTATALWYDETFMLYHAQRGVIAGTLGLLREDNALPLHGLLLALWVQVAGSGEFAVRYLSVLLGTLATAPVLRLGGALGGRRFGGWGAALAYATLPIYVYYAQEVRMYALVVPLAAAFAWTAWRVVERGHGTGAYVALGAAMLLAHLYAGLLWAATLVWGSLTFYVLRFRGRSSGTHHASRFPLASLRRWLRANLWLGCAALPIAAWASWRAGVDATAVSAVPPTALRWIPVLFGVGQYLPEPWTTVFIVVAATALAIALVGLVRAGRGTGALWLAATLVLPVALLLAATFVKAKWSERYLLPSLGLALVVGVGTGWEFGVTGGKEQEARGRRQEARSKRQEAGSRKAAVGRCWKMHGSGWRWTQRQGGYGCSTSGWGQRSLPERGRGRS